MNEQLRAEIRNLLTELGRAEYLDISVKLNQLAEFMSGALGEEESAFVFNTIKQNDGTWISKRNAVVARLQGRLHSSDWQTDLASPVSMTPNSLAIPQTNKVFIVHGHDEAARESVARFVEKLGLTAVILHEQASQSLTIIEKLERHSDVRFAVVLLTPDDIGSKSSESEKLVPRARQNVLIELGYFVGKLGRSYVCALRVGETEVPTDFSGVVYTNMDKAGAWRTKLAQELVSAKFSIDLTALVS